MVTDEWIETWLEKRFGGDTQFNRQFCRDLINDAVGSVDEISYEAVIPERNAASMPFTMVDLIIEQKRLLFSICELIIPWLQAGNRPRMWTGEYKDGARVYR